MKLPEIDYLYHKMFQIECTVYDLARYLFDTALNEKSIKRFHNFEPEKAHKEALKKFFRAKLRFDILIEYMNDLPFHKQNIPHILKTISVTKKVLSESLPGIPLDPMVYQIGDESDRRNISEVVFAVRLKAAAEKDNFYLVAADEYDQLRIELKSLCEQISSKIEKRIRAEDKR